MRCTAAAALLLSVSHRSRPRMATGSQDSGYPISPELRPADVLLRYFYDGGTLRQGHLCRLAPADTDSDTLSGLALLHALHDDGVDLERFYPSVRETEVSGGGWLSFLRGVVGAPPAEVESGEDITFQLPRDPSERRIDVKLFRRERPSAEEVRAGQDAAPAGRIARSGYYGVGVVGGKNANNLGTLWRSAFQLDAAFLFTVGGRYRAQATDTVNAASHGPHAASHGPPAASHGPHAASHGPHATSHGPHAASHGPHA